MRIRKTHDIPVVHEVCVRMGGESVGKSGGGGYEDREQGRQ